MQGLAKVVFAYNNKLLINYARRYKKVTIKISLESFVLNKVCFIIKNKLLCFLDIFICIFSKTSYTIVHIIFKKWANLAIIKSLPFYFEIVGKDPRWS